MFMMTKSASRLHPSAPAPYYLGEVLDGVLEGIALGHIDGLLALHGGDHHRMVRLERVNIVLLRLERRARGAKDLAVAQCSGSE